MAARRINDPDFERAKGISGALPTETVKRIVAAHSSTEVKSQAYTPDASDGRVTGTIAGIELRRGAHVARIKTTGLQGRDVAFGPQTRQLTNDMGADGLLITVPALVDEDAIEALRDVRALVKSYEADGLFSTTNRVLLGHGGQRQELLTSAAREMRARLLIVSRSNDYRTALQEMADAALKIAPSSGP